ncbi:MAG: RNA polymerase sigma factor [Candidatus Thiodiazotropha sp.]
MSIIPFSLYRGDSFERLLEPHFFQLYRLAYRLTGNQHDAEDLLQELLTKLYAKRQQLPHVDDLKTWLARALYNLYIDRIRSRNRSTLGHADPRLSERLEALSDDSDTPEQGQERWQQLEHLNQALNRLSESHRMLLILHDVEGYTLPELKEILDLPLGTLKSRLHRARAGLRQILAMEPSNDNGRVIY